MSVDISNFTNWFLQEFTRIGTWVLNTLDNIMLTTNVSLLDFIITLTIIGVFIGIILTLPQNANKQSIKYESKQRAKAKEKKK